MNCPGYTRPMALPDPLRVLHVITSTDAGGAERMLRRTLRALRENASPRVEVRVACVKGLGAIGRRLVEEGFDVTALDAAPPHGGGVGGALAWPLAELRVLRAIRRAIREFRPHVVQSWLPRADLLARVAAAGTDVPVIASVRVIDRDRDWPARLDGWTRGLVARWLAVSVAAADHHARVSGIPRERFVVIPNALEPGELDVPAEAATFRARHGIGAEDVLVVSVARLHPQKALDVLLCAAATLPRSVRIAIAGEGPQRAELEALAERLGMAARVHLVGRLEDPREMLGAADAFVLPSLFEGMPGALLEAMALGLPCVATAIPGTVEVVEDRATGLLVPPSDPEALESALRELLADPELRRRLGAAARDAVLREHGMDAHVRRVLELYGDVIG